MSLSEVSKDITPVIEVKVSWLLKIPLNFRLLQRSSHFSQSLQHISKNTEKCQSYPATDPRTSKGNIASKITPRQCSYLTSTCLMCVRICVDCGKQLKASRQNTIRVSSHRCTICQSMGHTPGTKPEFLPQLFQTYDQRPSPARILASSPSILHSIS